MNARYEMTAEVARAKARRGHAVRRAEVFRITRKDGDTDVVTMDDIATRLGVTKRVAQRRMQRERAKPGVVTWEGLA